MKARALAGLAWFGASTVLLRRTDPIVGSVIVTDRCNLHCRHCAVANIRRTDYPMGRISADMADLYRRGCRILFLYGGEPFLWRDGDLRLVDVVAQARRIGFPMVNVVTNGTQGLDLPGADMLMVSLDGTRVNHDRIRGHNYDTVLANIEAAPAANITLYMAINRINIGDIGHVARLALDMANVRSVAFNVHTPYPGTEGLSLTLDQKREAADRIAELKHAGYPVLDLVSALPAIADNDFPTPCRQCLITEDGRTWVCGRCIEEPGLCDECGYFFAAELSLLFAGRRDVVAEALRSYPRFLRSPSRGGA